MTSTKNINHLFRNCQENRKKKKKRQKLTLRFDFPEKKLTFNFWFWAGKFSLASFLKFIKGVVEVFYSPQQIREIEIESCEVRYSEMRVRGKEKEGERKGIFAWAGEMILGVRGDDGGERKIKIIWGDKRGGRMGRKKMIRKKGRTIDAFVVEIYLRGDGLISLEKLYNHLKSQRRKVDVEDEEWRSASERKIKEIKWVRMMKLTDWNGDILRGIAEKIRKEIWRAVGDTHRILRRGIRIEVREDGKIYEVEGRKRKGKKGWEWKEIRRREIGEWDIRYGEIRCSDFSFIPYKIRKRKKEIEIRDSRNNGMKYLGGRDNAIGLAEYLWGDDGEWEGDFGKWEGDFGNGCSLIEEKRKKEIRINYAKALPQKPESFVRFVERYKEGIGRLRRKYFISRLLDFLYDEGIEFRKEKRGWGVVRVSSSRYLFFLDWLYIRYLEKLRKFKREGQERGRDGLIFPPLLHSRFIPYSINLNTQSRDPPPAGGGGSSLSVSLLSFPVVEEVVKE